MSSDTKKKEKTKVEISADRDVSVMEPAGDEQNLENLLQMVEPKNLHGEIDFGKRLGKETC